MNLNSPNRRMRTRTSDGVGGVRQGEPAAPTRSPALAADGRWGARVVGRVGRSAHRAARGERHPIVLPLHHALGSAEPLEARRRVADDVELAWLGRAGVTCLERRLAVCKAREAHRDGVDLEAIPAEASAVRARGDERADLLREARAGRRTGVGTCIVTRVARRDDVESAARECIDACVLLDGWVRIDGPASGERRAE